MIQKKKFRKGSFEYKMFLSISLFVGLTLTFLVIATRDGISLQNPLSNQFTNQSLEGGSNFSGTGSVTTLDNLRALFRLSSPFFWLSGTIILAITVFGIVWLLNYIRGR